MRTLLLTAFLGLSAVWGSPVRADIGGDASFVAGPLDHPDGLQGPELVISSSGNAFVTIPSQKVTQDESIAIHRSTDGGTTWETWGVFDNPSSDISYEDPALACASGTGGEWVYLAYEYIDLGITHYRVSRADPDDSAPVWQTATVSILPIPVGAFPHPHGLRMSTRSSTIGDPTVAVSYSVLDSGQTDLYYTVSADGGLTYTSPGLIHTFVHPALGVAKLEHDLALGGNSRVHVAVLEVVSQRFPESSELKYLSAVFDGTALATWSAATSLRSKAEDGYATVTLAADATGDDIVAGFVDWMDDGTHEFRLLASTDAGAFFSDVFTAAQASGIEDLREPRLTWTPGGPVCVGIDSSVRGILIGRPNGAFTNSWGIEEFLPTLDRSENTGMVAADPSRSNQLAIVGTLFSHRSHVNDDESLWFNAEWRTGLGYGVSERAFPASLSSGFNSSPALADLEGNGRTDILVTAGSGRIYTFEAWPGIDRLGFVGPTSDASAPAAFDLDADGNLEIFVGCDDGKVYGLELDPVSFFLPLLPRWPIDLGTSAPVYVSVAPVTGYAHGEVVAVSDDVVDVRSLFGNSRSGFPVQIPAAGGTARGRAALGDVDDDGAVELVVATSSSVAVLGPTGDVEIVLQTGTPGPSAGVSLADLDQDGDLEVAIPMVDGTVRLLHHDGTAFGVGWPYDTATGQPVSGVAIATFADALTPALGFVTRNGHAFAVDAQGSDVTGWPFSLGNGDRFLHEPIFARVAKPNFQRPQLIASTEAGIGHVLRFAGGDVIGWPRVLNDLGGGPSPAAADFDADGFVELVVPAGEYLWVLDMGVAPLALEGRRWPMAGHDAGRSGCADCAPDTPTAVAPDLPNGTRVSFAGARPNPSPGETRLHFALPGRGQVELAMYDTRGRLVRSVMDEEREAGGHTVTWDGRDARGRPVSTGTYFARLQTGRGPVQYVMVRKVVIAR